jgi:hypothetical protein
MAQRKASPAPVHGKRVPLLIMIVHSKPAGKPPPKAQRKTPAKSKR